MSPHHTISADIRHGGHWVRAHLVRCGAEYSASFTCDGCRDARPVHFRPGPVTSPLALVALALQEKVTADFLWAAHRTPARTPNVAGAIGAALCGAGVLVFLAFLLAGAFG